jgi:hypothetical protein
MRFLEKALVSSCRVSDNELPDRTITEVFHFRFMQSQIRTLCSDYSTKYKLRGLAWILLKLKRLTFQPHDSY